VTLSDRHGPDVHGPDRQGLHVVVAAVQARASYLRCSPVAPADEGWIRCADLVGDPERLRREIDATAAGRGTADPQVAASLYAQAYAFRVPSIAVAAYGLGLPVPSAAPAVTAVRVGRHRPAELAILDATCRTMGAAEVARMVVDEHLAPFVAAVRATTRIGERLLWGNVAASIAAVFRSVQGVGPGGDPDVRARAQKLFTAASRLDGLGGYTCLEVPGALGWYWDRTSCCLWYQTTSGAYCDDCSLHDPSELAARRRADLLGSTAP
jgi:ferric iron reductase protein FhuF